jgi:hypothetical protein
MIVGGDGVGLNGRRAQAHAAEELQANILQKYPGFSISGLL